MKKYVGLSGGKVFSFLILLVATCVSISQAAIKTAQVSVREVKGNASFLIGGSWQALKPHMALAEGAVVKTEADSTLDLVFQDSGTALRLTPDSKLRLDKIAVDRVGGGVITDTSLTLLSGAVAGTQRKLAMPSRFEIQTETATAEIVGTEYYVRADGAVTVVSGAVSLNFNKPANGGSVKVTVQAGFSFDPKTGQVVPTTPAYLQNIVAHIITTKNNAEVFKVGGATLVVKPEKPVSPSQGGGEGDQGNGNGNGKGNGNGNGNGKGNGNDNGNGNGNGNGKGNGNENGNGNGNGNGKGNGKGKS
jgi:hypothetical protein